jgi:hypothetical protein
MKKQAIATAVILGILAGAGTALAEPEGDQGRHLGQRRHGRHGQRRGDRRGHLKEMDVNDDQQITYEEFKAYAEKRIKERFGKLDRNGDGVLDREDRDLAREEFGEKRGEKRGQAREKIRERRQERRQNRRGGEDNGDDV